MNLPTWVAPMAPELKAFYAEMTGKIAAALPENFPQAPDRTWMQKVTNAAREEPWDMEALSDAFVNPVWLYLARGGKRLRSVLTAAVLQTLGVAPERYLPLLATIEVLEDSTILVDDVFDDSDLRRGGPTAHVVYNPLTAVNAGYGVFKQSIELFYNNRLGLSERTVCALLDAWAEESLLVACGHAEEWFWTADRRVDVTESQYYQQLIGRMAFLSFRGPCRMAALIAGAEPAVVNALSQYGISTGLAYHLRGDLLNLQPASGEWGKAIGDDLYGGRRTLLTLHTLAVAAEPDRIRLLEILDARTRDERTLKEGIDIILRYDAVPYVKGRVEAHIQNALTALNGVPGPEGSKNLLVQFLRFAATDRVN